MPLEYHAGLEQSFSGWADLIERMANDERAAFQARGYLEKLEPYLAGRNAAAMSSGDGVVMWAYAASLAPLARLCYFYSDCAILR